MTGLLEYFEVGMIEHSAEGGEHGALRAKRKEHGAWRLGRGDHLT